MPDHNILELAVDLLIGAIIYVVNLLLASRGAARRCLLMEWG